MKMSSSIILSDFSLLQGKKKLLISSSLCLNETGLYYLTGPNGSGKTTLLSALSGRHSFKGSYVCQSKTVDENSNGKSLPDVGLVLSDSPLIGNLSVKDNILFLYKDKDKQKLDKILEELDLTSVKDSKVKHLSEGEKRRTQLGVELFGGKKIILIDEPTASLDENNSKKIIQIIRELSKTRLVIVTTNERLHPLESGEYTGLIRIENKKLILRKGNLDSEKVPIEEEVQEKTSLLNFIRSILFNNKLIIILLTVFAVIPSLLFGFCLFPAYGDSSSGISSLNYQSAKDNYEYVLFSTKDDEKPEVDLTADKDFFLYKAITNTNIMLVDTTRDNRYPSVINDMRNYVSMVSLVDQSKLSSYSLKRAVFL